MVHRSFHFLVTFVKLNIQMELPSESGYDPEIEPEFWKPIFGENEMITIRQKIN